MTKSIKCIYILFLVLSILSNRKLCSANDTINTTKSIRDDETLVSSGGSFELGFFNPGKSQNWYLGIWYKNITLKTVVWVANREIPLKNRSSGILKVIQTGQLVLLNDTNSTIWSSNSSRASQNLVAQLLDSGNLVLRDENDNDPENYLWQSFDYPTDTMLAGMNFGWNNRTGVESFLSSWKTNDDPAPGNFTYHLDPTGYPQGIIRSGAEIVYRMGPWNGKFFSGTPDLSSDPTLTFGLYITKNRVSYRGELKYKSPMSRFTLDPSGDGHRWTWVDDRGWVPYISIPADICDQYNFCGAYGSCNARNVPVCGCLDKFLPKDPEGWVVSDWSNGCVRRTVLNCTAGDGFLKYSNIKLPDATTSWYNGSMTLKECKVECLKNCCCTAYTNLDISKGGSGCILWFGDLLDIRIFSTEGQDLYIRMASSELESNGNSKERIAWSLTTVGIVLLALTLLLYIWKRKKKSKKGTKSGRQDETNNQDFELPFFDLSTILKATDNFSLKNKLGEGGYGPVYKGILDKGQDIAIKRQSKTSKQGLDEFKNEVICIAKLQHRNLVKLLGYCVQGEEKMLVYEYMPNKSLDLILFDERNRVCLDWPKRLHIVNGIARGLVYLHEDSRLRIIHRDLKASNILLDNEMNPKISDFGIAKRFKGNETGDMTSRVVGTYGYISPEYAARGQFSVKSDVFSFGVIVLEIVSGKRNSAFCYGDCNLSLLGHAWTLYKEGRSIELVDSSLQNLDCIGHVLQIIHVGLLCVQQRAHDRPTMTSVVSMLSNDGMLPQANHPGFFEEGSVAPESMTSSNPFSSMNEITITCLDGR